MKKLMYLLPFAALAMASCSSSEDVAQNVQPPSQELKFFPAVEGTTRGAIETSSSISKFYLYATGDLKTSATATDGTEAYTPAWQAVTKNGSNWEPTTTKLYWAKDDEVSPAGPATGNFLAFANATKLADGTEHDGTGITSQLDIVIPTDLSKQKDLVVAYNSGLRTVFTSGVPLHFRHALSQVVVNATYANDAEYISTKPELVVNVRGIKFVGLNNQGTLNLPTASTASGQTYEPVWGSQSGTVDFAAAPASAVGLSSTPQFIDQSAANSPLLLMPQITAATTNLAATPTVTGAYLMVEVDIDEKVSGNAVYPKDGYTGNGGYAWIAVPVDINWKGGYKYTYTLNFSNIAAGKVAPGTTSAETDQTVGDPVIAGVRTPVNFLVTVEEAWIDGGSFTPAM